MRTTRIAGVKSPTWVRALQIGIGAIAIVLSLAAIIYPVLTVVATLTVAAIILLLFGIENIVAGIFVYKQARAAHIGLGILVIILAVLVMAFPLGAAMFVAILAGVALMFSGFASIVAGLMGVSERATDTTPSRGARIFSVIAGALAVALSVMILAFPAFGIELVAIVIGIGLLVYGIRLVVTGISGRGQA
ncbi:HdeD family acid-resistance protein [Nitrososphaera viennensis]|uniref:Acid-resistance membrane protein n=2 Tax=Nitrososphaera viennensis TaxID=1034015 RepID=A0A060HJN7_9ARCH|nr:DUF308 domain-containing protein [Nitrososphaera viennensis]AIC16764.1 membrane protein of unknown function [Nitrososphaera viennensis EN76]UVS68674.1 DUF308 domain-containing protein [Nitrososphaera viennensis]